MFEILIFWDMQVYLLPKSSSWTSHDTAGCYVGWSNQTTSATCATRPSRAALVLGLEGFLAARVGDSNWLPSPEALGWLSLVLSRLTVVREFCLGSIHCASVYSPKKNKWRRQWKPTFLIGEAKVYLRKPWFLVSSFWKTWNPKKCAKARPCESPRTPRLPASPWAMQRMELGSYGWSPWLILHWYGIITLWYVWYVYYIAYERI